MDSLYTIGSGIASLNDVYDKKALSIAADTFTDDSIPENEKIGVVILNYQTRYQSGAWIKTAIMDIWDNYPYAYEPDYYFGVGTFSLGLSE